MSLFTLLASNRSSLLAYLAAYWKLDEASGDRADSAGSSTLTDNNTVTQAAGKVGTSAQFMAANSEYLSAADSAALSTGNISFTFSAWVYMDSDTGDNQTIISKDTGAGPNREYQLRYDFATSRFRFFFFDGTNTTGAVTASTIGAPSLSTWYHIVCYHDADNSRLGISVNGGAVDDAAATGDPADTGTAFQLGGRNGAAFWSGRIDEVGFWKRLLSPSEKAALYNSGSGRTHPFV